MPVDTNIYGKLQAPQPLQQLGQFAQLQNQLNANAQFQQQFQAKQALGALAQQSIDPGTGQMDWNKYALSISTDPRTAFMAREVIESMSRQKLLDAETFGKQVQNAQLTTNMIGNAITPVVMAWNKAGQAPSDKSDPNKADMTELLHQGSLIIGQNPAMRDQVLNFLTSIRTLPKAQVLPALNAFAANVAIAQKGLESVYKPFSVNAGGATVMGTQNLLGGPGAMTESGRVTQTLTPEQANALVTTKEPLTGAEQKTPRAALPLVGGMMPEVQGAGGAPSGGATPVQTVPITGKPQQGEVGTTSNSMTPAAPGQSNMTFQAGPTQAQTEGIKYVTEKYAPELYERNQNAMQLKLLMDQAQEETRSFKQGGGASMYMKMGQLAQALGVKSDAVDRLANGDLASSQAANKLFMQVGSQVAAALVRAGGGRMTQTEWSKVLAEGSANIDMDPKAISRIMAAMRELTHYTNMEAQAYEMARKDSNFNLADFPGTWQSTLGKFLDARAKSKGLRQ